MIAAALAALAFASPQAATLVPYPPPVPKGYYCAAPAPQTSQPQPSRSKLTPYPAGPNARSCYQPGVKSQSSGAIHGHVLVPYPSP